eukprot:GHVH01014770.1.p1 GENE.GHVH01014770.1~~GHVH01014770.1.p1  ORF type:complete len:302 (-),score=16.38 GHVH01014770.1:212-1117(-)
MYSFNFWMLSASASGSVANYESVSLLGHKSKSEEMHCSNHALLPMLYNVDDASDIAVFDSSPQADFDGCVDWVMANYDPSPVQYILYLGEHEVDNCRLTSAQMSPDSRLNCYNDYGYEFDSCYFGEHGVDCDGPLEEKCVTLDAERVVGTGRDTHLEKSHIFPYSMEGCKAAFSDPNPWPFTYVYTELTGECQQSSSWTYELQREYKYEYVSAGMNITSCASVPADTVYPPSRDTTTKTPCVDTVDHCETLVSYETACTLGFDFDELTPALPTSTVCPATCAAKFPSKNCQEWLEFRNLEN